MQYRKKSRRPTAKIVPGSRLVKFGIQDRHNFRRGSRKLMSRDIANAFERKSFGFLPVRLTDCRIREKIPTFQRQIHA